MEQSVKSEIEVIYALRGNVHVTAALRELEKELFWKPCCILAERSNLAYARELYPDILLIDNKAAHLDLDARYRSLKSFYDVDIRDKYGKYESEVCKNLERVLPSLYHQISERLFFFHVWLMYWLEMVRELRPDLAFFVNSPMLPHHFILYLVCVEERIEVLLGNNIAHPSRLTNFKTKIGSLPIGLVDNFQRKQILFREKGVRVISGYAEEYFRKNQEYQVPDYLAKKQARENQRGIIGSLLRIKNHSVGKSLGKTLAYVLYVYHVLRKKQHRVASYLPERKKVQLADYYHSISIEEPSLQQNYVYLPLHYQPERTTSPDAGIFADQHLIAKTLDRALPPGWKIYIKEHPSQFASYSEGEKGREIADYEELQRLESAVFIGERFPTSELIMHAGAVATCTGTAGWEAVLRGIPVLVFGTIWYDLCRGVFRVRSVAELKEAIAQILTGVRPDEAQAKLLIESVTEVSCALWDAETGAFNRQGFVSCLKNAYQAEPSYDHLLIARARAGTA